LKGHFPKLKYRETGQKILYESSQADTALLKKLTGWTPPHRIEDAIPKIIEFEKKVVFHDEQTNFNVLITSASRKIGMLKAIKSGMAKAGNNGQLYAGDISDECLARHFADKFWKMPKTREENTDEILTYCQKNNIKLIIPSRDGELEFWAKKKDSFAKKGIHLMVAKPQAIKWSVDKLAFYTASNKYGLSAIETADSPNRLKTKRFVVKERYGAGSKSIALDVSLEEAIEHAKTLEAPIFQPFIKGREYSADFYVSERGEVKGVIVRERNLVVNGESQITTTITNETIEKLCHNLASAFKLYGHNILQVLVDPSGKIHLIECNPRFGGASTTALAAGLDSFYWLMLEALHQDIKDYPFARVKGEIMQIRFPDDLIVAV
jgi:carbamoyl-phosphate synthase large subunit